MKVRGCEAPWVEENCIYISSDDLWASKLQGKRVVHWRNPNPSFKTARVVIIGPATELCPNPDIVTGRQVVAKGCFTVPALEWYGTNNGDDDGDLGNFFVLEEIAQWTANAKNHKHLEKMQYLYESIYG
jgi:hypothetical protein